VIGSGMGRQACAGAAALDGPRSLNAVGVPDRARLNAMAPRSILATRRARKPVSSSVCELGSSTGLAGLQDSSRVPSEPGAGRADD
jgi:hypothetical protein